MCLLVPVYHCLVLLPQHMNIIIMIGQYKTSTQTIQEVMKAFIHELTEHNWTRKHNWPMFPLSLTAHMNETKQTRRNKLTGGNTGRWRRRWALVEVSYGRPTALVSCLAPSYSGASSLVFAGAGPPLRRHPPWALGWQTWRPLDPAAASPSSPGSTTCSCATRRHWRSSL